MKYEFHPEALAEYKDAAHYYAGCQNGLELRFIAAIEHAIRRILEAPERYQFFDGDIRRCLTRVFPYAILYTIEAEFVLIIAIMHSHREPGYWRHRFSPKI